VSGRCLCCYVRPPTFLKWNNLCDLVYQTLTKSYQSQIPVAFGITGHVTIKHLLDTLLGTENVPYISHNRITVSVKSYT